MSWRVSAELAAQSLAAARAAATAAFTSASPACGIVAQGRPLEGSTASKPPLAATASPPITSS